jgi:hypothetical protein
VKPPQNSATAPAGTEVRCAIAAFGSVLYTLDMFPALRQRPGPGVGQFLPNNFLKHADELTVASLAAVLQAIDRFGMGAEADFERWGVVAAPAFLGRATLVTALQRYADEGAWGLSPHFIPHRSQHAVAGTISQALKIHGPNFGSGGGPGGIAEGMLAGAILLDGNRLPGVWVALAGWEPEFVPDHDGKPTTNCICRAVALALTPSDQRQQAMGLRVLPAGRAGHYGPSNGAVFRSNPTLETLQQSLAEPDAIPTKLNWSINGTAAIELDVHRNGRNSSDAAVGHRPVGRAWRFGQAGAGTENKR